MWHVIIPVKRWDASKSRIALPLADRRALAEAMATDTIDAVKAARAVTQVTVVTTSSDMSMTTALSAADVVLVQPRGGIDDAVKWAVQESVPPGTPVAALVADLPAITGPSLDIALRAAAFEKSAYVVDRHRSGTTVLTALSAQTLKPSFGVGSARRHLELGATPLPSTVVAPSLACDVDTLDDLRAAERLGPGAHTSLVLASLRSPRPRDSLDSLGSRP